MVRPIVMCCGYILLAKNDEGKTCGSVVSNHTSKDGGL